MLKVTQSLRQISFLRNLSSKYSIGIHSKVGITDNLTPVNFIPISNLISHYHTTSKCFNFKGFDDEDGYFKGTQQNSTRRYDEPDSYNRNQRFERNRFGNSNNRSNNNGFGNDYSNTTHHHNEAVDKSNLITIKKNFFSPTEQLLSRVDSDNQRFLAEHNISIQGSNISPPIQQFSDHEFPDNLVNKLKQFSAPTAIQAQGWSIALSGEDLIGIGQTGSGKTLGYLLPALLHIAHHKQVYSQDKTSYTNAPLGLVMAPTRELVQQIFQVAIEYGNAMGIRCVSMFGGASRSIQLDNLNKNSAQLVIGTPGRLLDVLSTGELQLSRCSFAVLDEADRMLDMGFEPQIREIMAKTRPERQTLMWSATWPLEVREMAGMFLEKPVMMTVGSTELRANPDIRQLVSIVEPQSKNSKLMAIIDQLLENDPKAQLMVFTNTKRAAEFITSFLKNNSLRAESIHGDKTQRMRDNVLNGFRREHIRILVATDVAARGIDVPDLACVVNYDMTRNIEDYVHRIGRTGRCGKAGAAHSLLTAADAGITKDLIKVLRDAKQEVHPTLEALSREAGRGGKQQNRNGGYRSNNHSWNGPNRGGNHYGNNNNSQRSRW